jgi:uncharacterized membrane protein
MNTKNNFPYKPNDYESEKASFSYLMSLITIIVGLPMPVINLISTLAFYLSNRKSSYFIRWHCIQTLLLQIFIVIINAYPFGLIFSIIFNNGQITNNLIAYLITAVLFNLSGFILTIYAAIYTGRGKHVYWWLWGDLADLICREKI